MSKPIIRSSLCRMSSTNLSPSLLRSVPTILGLVTPVMLRRREGGSGPRMPDRMMRIVMTARGCSLVGNCKADAHHVFVRRRRIFRTHAERFLTQRVTEATDQNRTMAAGRNLPWRYVGGWNSPELLKT
jgi:hypothetical protein